MSIPDCIQYIKNEIKIFTRRSEFEPESKLDEYSIGIPCCDCDATGKIKLSQLNIHLPFPRDPDLYYSW